MRQDTFYITGFNEFGQVIKSLNIDILDGTIHDYNCQCVQDSKNESERVYEIEVITNQNLEV